MTLVERVSSRAVRLMREEGVGLAAATLKAYDQECVLQEKQIRHLKMLLEDISAHEAAGVNPGKMTDENALSIRQMIQKGLFEVPQS